MSNNGQLLHCKRSPGVCDNQRFEELRCLGPYFGFKEKKNESNFSLDSPTISPDCAPEGIEKTSTPIEKDDSDKSHHHSFASSKQEEFKELLQRKENDVLCCWKTGEGKTKVMLDVVCDEDELSIIVIPTLSLILDIAGELTRRQAHSF